MLLLSCSLYKVAQAWHCAAPLASVRHGAAVQQCALASPHKVVLPHQPLHPVDPNGRHTGEEAPQRATYMARLRGLTQAPGEAGSPDDRLLSSSLLQPSGTPASNPYPQRHITSRRRITDTQDSSLQRPHEYAERCAGAAPRLGLQLAGAGVLGSAGVRCLRAGPCRGAGGGQLMQS